MITRPDCRYQFDRYEQKGNHPVDILDEGPETGDESDEDIIRNYLPGDNHDIIRNYEPHHNIPAINITLHSANTNHVLGRSLTVQKQKSESTFG